MKARKSFISVFFGYHVSDPLIVDVYFNFTHPNVNGLYVKKYSDISEASIARLISFTRPGYRAPSKTYWHVTPPTKRNPNRHFLLTINS